MNFKVYNPEPMSRTRHSENGEPLGLDAYQEFVGETGRINAPSADRLKIFLLGLFGETGSLLGELKKNLRDKDSYDAYQESVLEEFGDVLWYFASVARLKDARLSEIAGDASGRLAGRGCRIKDDPVTFADLQFSKAERANQQPLILAGKVGQLVDVLIVEDFNDERNRFWNNLVEVFLALVEAASAADVDLDKAARHNRKKILDRWPINEEWGSLYDDEFDEDEQLPRRIEMVFKEKNIAGKKHVIQKCNGIKVGSPLTDNRHDADDYRFHDVFHLTYAAVLGWSPVLRALFRLKRKSLPQIDENEDGARAIVIEESVSIWIFNYGLKHDLFRNVETGALDSRILRSVRRLVDGYEVQDRPSWQWERAILEGFRVFRELKEHRGGTVVADLNERSVTFIEPE
ncbi:MAG: nucleoside triphosphate pyrophosphohydrolase family protein [Alphaproteobacteria bacterium]|nr:nucleoside triphosphate pyrophosphohydrolase family protein [Alphaproteobacteria bacterium]